MSKFGQLILRKIIKIKSYNAPNSLFAGAPLQTQLKQLTALPQTP